MTGQFVEFGGIRVDISQLDFSNTSSKVNDVRTANIVLISLVVTTVSLRLVARTRFVRRIFPDDVFIIIAAVFTLALAATCIAATRSGLGTHIWLLPMDTVSQQMKSCILYLLVCQVLYAFAIALTKIAIISSYLRFIQDNTFRLIMYMTIFVTFGLLICGIFVSLFQCKPISGAWNFDANGSCINYIDYLYASSAINIFTDIVLCALPIPHLWKLHMPLKQRVVLCVLFIGGAGACVAGIVRIAFLDSLRVLDVPYQSVTSLNLSVIECSLGIICVSIPALRPMVIKMFPNGSRVTRTASSNAKTSTSQSLPLSTITPYPKTSKIQSEITYNTRSFERLSSFEERQGSS